MLALDAQHAVYNFLLEYYHVKGQKGTRALARWSPPLIADEASSCATLLEGADADDLACGRLSLRGAEVTAEGIVYDVATAFAGASTERATPFVWYRDILRNTTGAEPVLHCYGLHEWAMQYHPDGADPPPSARFQMQSMPLRVPRKTINEAIERRGIACTHVDALRFFAPAAAPLNSHGASLTRTQQLDLEQPACVHAHMDLLKISMRLSPWLSAEIVADALEVSIAARSLDVAASPYDASRFGLDAVRVETPSGRAEYRRQQTLLMERAAPVRAALLESYTAFLLAAFGEAHVHLAQRSPSSERFAVATPGGPPWRRSLLPRPTLPHAVARSTQPSMLAASAHAISPTHTEFVAQRTAPLPGHPDAPPARDGESASLLTR